ncbi:MAG: hypothetical protein HYR84_13460 [Planctomycetes bacterium]|nr:hypothetical protein [Planctomycetota bacterium]
MTWLLFCEQRYCDAADAKDAKRTCTPRKMHKDREYSRADKICKYKDSKEGRKAGIGLAIFSCLPAFLIERDFDGPLQQPVNGYKNDCGASEEDSHHRAFVAGASG